MPFWVGSTRYRLIRRYICAGQNLPLVRFARFADLEKLHKVMPRANMGFGDVPVLPVIDLDSDEEMEVDVAVVNIWHVGPVPNRADVDRRNREFIRARDNAGSR